jgi:hypothetical protein
MQTHGDNHIHVGGMPDIPGLIIDKGKEMLQQCTKDVGTAITWIPFSYNMYLESGGMLNSMAQVNHEETVKELGGKKTLSDALNLNPHDVHGWKQNWDKGVDDFFSRNSAQNVPNEGAQRQIESFAKWITKSPGKIGEVVGSGVGGIADVLGRIVN